MKKLLTILMALMMVLSMTVAVFAADIAETGTITIKETVMNQEYSIYQMATLDSYDTEKGAYLYTPVAEWTDFFESKPDYFGFENGKIILNAELSADQAAALAKDALAYAEAKSLNTTGDAQTASADGEEIVFSDLSLGYYLVDSSLGAFCGLTTTDPTAEVKEKNSISKADKTVEEDSSGVYGDKNDADMFQTINYKTVITVQKGAENYVLHDKMDAGLTFIGVSSVKVGDADVAAENYTVTSTGLADGCTFDIAFSDTYVASLEEGTEIVVSYTAYLNENAVIAGDGNVNKTWLDYGDNNSTTHDTTTTYTYSFDLVKTDASDKVLDGAEFKLYDAATGGNEIAVVKVSDGVYRVAKSDETGVAIVPVNGVATVKGLDGGTTYYLEETVAPTGYNKLTARQSFTIDASNLSATFNENVYVANTGVQVVNKTGSVLPETGSFGTTMFIVIGGIVMLAAGVLLFAKKRMSQVAE